MILIVGSPLPRERGALNMGFLFGDVRIGLYVDVDG